MNEPQVSVIIPAYNCEKTIAQCLKAVKEQTFKNIKEIIVSDDGSKDSTASIVKSFPDVSYVCQPNAGPATARNRGAKIATSEILFFTDSDCVPNSNWVEKSIKHFENKDIAVVMGSYDIANSSSILSRCIHKEIVYRHNNLLPEYPKVFGSYNFGIRKKIFDELSGFNEEYRYASGEDNDLSYRILKINKKIFFERESKVKHYHTESISRYLREQYRHGFWRAKLYLMHPKMMQGDNYTFWKDMADVPLVSFVLISFMLSLLSIRTYGILFLFFVLFTYFFNLFFANRFTRNIFEAIFYSFILFFRSFSRTIGISSGIISFLLKK